MTPITLADAIALSAYVLGTLIAAGAAVVLLMLARGNRIAWVGVAVFALIAGVFLHELIEARPVLIHSPAAR